MAISDQGLQLDALVQMSFHLALQLVGRHVLQLSRHIAAIETNLIDSIDTFCHDGAAQARNLVIGLQTRL